MKQIDAPSIRFRPSPGIVLVEPLDGNSDDKIKWSSETKGKIGLGKVVSVGDTVLTDFGAEIECPVQPGDTVYFLRYESGYDESTINGKTYVWALFRDIRGIEDYNEN